jgi:hypothetical protein
LSGAFERPRSSSALVPAPKRMESPKSFPLSPGILRLIGADAVRNEFIHPIEALRWCQYDLARKTNQRYLHEDKIVIANYLTSVL